jgi:hypothetical protein
VVSTCISKLRTRVSRQTSISQTHVKFYCGSHMVHSRTSTEIYVCPVIGQPVLGLFSSLFDQRPLEGGCAVTRYLLVGYGNIFSLALGESKVFAMLRYPLCTDPPSPLDFCTLKHRFNDYYLFAAFPTTRCGTHTLDCELSLSTGPMQLSILDSSET